MKSKKNPVGILVLSIVFVLVITGCDTDDGVNPLVVADFYGHWTSNNNDVYCISATDIFFSKGFLAGYYDLLTAVIVENENELNKSEYPRGFIFTSTGAIKFLYMSANKTRFVDTEDSVVYSKSAGCNCTGKITVSNFIGTWQRTAGLNSPQTLTINNSTLRVENNSSQEYNFSITKWENKLNDHNNIMFSATDFPAGYKLTGTTGTNTLMGVVIGGNFTEISLYINKDKNKLWIVWGTNPSEGFFEKK